MEIDSDDNICILNSDPEEDSTDDDTCIIISDVEDEQTAPEDNDKHYRGKYVEKTTDELHDSGSSCDTHANLGQQVEEQVNFRLVTKVSTSTIAQLSHKTPPLYQQDNHVHSNTAFQNFTPSKSFKSKVTNPTSTIPLLSNMQLIHSNYHDTGMLRSQNGNFQVQPDINKSNKRNWKQNNVYSKGTSSVNINSEICHGPTNTYIQNMDNSSKNYCNNSRSSNESINFGTDQIQVENSSNKQTVIQNSVLNTSENGISDMDMDMFNVKPASHDSFSEIDTDRRNDNSEEASIETESNKKTKTSHDCNDSVWETAVEKTLVTVIQKSVLIEQKKSMVEKSELHQCNYVISKLDELKQRNMSSAIDSNVSMSKQKHRANILRKNTTTEEPGQRKLRSLHHESLTKRKTPPISSEVMNKDNLSSINSKNTKTKEEIYNSGKLQPVRPKGSQVFSPVQVVLVDGAVQEIVSNNQKLNNETESYQSKIVENNTKQQAQSFSDELVGESCENHNSVTSSNSENVIHVNQQTKSSPEINIQKNIKQSLNNITTAPVLKLKSRHSIKICPPDINEDNVNKNVNDYYKRSASKKPVGVMDSKITKKELSSSKVNTIVNKMLDENNEKEVSNVNMTKIDRVSGLNLSVVEIISDSDSDFKNIACGSIEPADSEQQMYQNATKTNDQQVEKKKETELAKHHVCKECGVIFKEELSLNFHMTKHSSTSQFFFPCDQCGKNCLSKESLESHIYVVHGKADLQTCQYCNKKIKGVNAKTLLLQHIDKKHNFKCDICTESFILKSNLTKHEIKVHKCSRTIQCEICRRRFATESGLYTHTAISHEGRNNPPEKCYVCGLTYTNLRSLRVHMREKHQITCLVRKSKITYIPALK